MYIPVLIQCQYCLACGKPYIAIGGFLNCQKCLEELLKKTNRREHPKEVICSNGSGENIQRS